MKTRFSRSLVCLLLVFAAASLAPAQAPSGALAAGQSLLEQKKPESALAEFKKAMTEAPTSYEGYFLAAVASYRLGDLVGAEEYAKVALEKAPEGEEAKIQEMLGVIGERQRFEKLEREGDEALAGGRRAKAAELYAKAYALFPKDGSAGLKAASLYADKLSKLLDAAIIWQQVASQSDEASRKEARAELSKRYLELDKLFRSRVYDARTSRRKQAEEILEGLCTAFPDKVEAHVEAAEWYAGHSKFEKAIEHLSRASALGVEAKAIQFRQGLIYGVCYKDGAPLRTFIEEAFGAEVLAKMKQVPVWGVDETAPPEIHGLLKEAVDEQYVWALRVMGDSYERQGRLRDVARAYVEAARWYQRAIDLGDPAAMVKLGTLYKYGNGVETDDARAIALYQKAAALGDVDGYWHWGGIEAAKNPEAAERLWIKGAEAGSVHSAGKLSKLYRSQGRYEQAMAWARKLVEDGPLKFPMVGYYELGLSYRDAPLPLRNLAEARRCLEIAANEGEFDAQKALAALP